MTDAPFTIVSSPAMQLVEAAAELEHLAQTKAADQDLIGDDDGPHWRAVEHAEEVLSRIDPTAMCTVQELDRQNDARGREIARLRADLARYVGHEPTIREEMTELGRRLDAVEALLPADPAEDINAAWIPPHRIRAAANGETDHEPATDPIVVRWDRTVIHPEQPGEDTIVCCLTTDGQPVALFLDDELREALGLALVDPNPAN